MGTNYQWHAEPRCPHCDQERGEVKHIGKSSAGWCFSLHVYPDDHINTLSDWLNLFTLPDSYITNEYGERVSMGDMVSCITERNRKGRQHHDQDFLRLNCAEPGPNGLLRHSIGHGCIGHGEGPYDYITGEFS